MKLATLALTCPLLLLAACQNREAKLFDEMSGPEKAVVPAIKSYHACYAALVQKAKTERRRLSDDELGHLGFKCPAELASAAEAVDRLWMSDRYKHRDDPDAYSPDRWVRIAFHKKELAGAYTCEFTKCQRID